MHVVPAQRACPRNLDATLAHDQRTSNPDQADLLHCRRRPPASKHSAAAAAHAQPGSSRQRKPQGIAHIASAAKSGLPSHKGATAGHALLHRRVDTSLYVRGVNGVSGQNTIVKNAGKEKTDEQAVTKEVPVTAAAGAAAQLKDPQLLARYGLAQTSSCVASVATQCTTSA